MGMTISADLLMAIYPIAASFDAIQQDLADLEKCRFLLPSGKARTWTFAQARKLPAFG